MIIVCCSKVFQRIQLPKKIRHAIKMHFIDQSGSPLCEKSAALKAFKAVLRCCCSLRWWMKGSAEFEPWREQFDETERKKSILSLWPACNRASLSGVCHTVFSEEVLTAEVSDQAALEENRTTDSDI